ncbi:GTP-binding protein of the rho subfamily of ras-like protein [Serendipita vermifera]|nr:GTP-binding protein of the rho subfamily of ras-like protein [Serendipita vermifera]
MIIKYSNVSKQESTRPKVVVVGDGSVGKTCLIIAFCHGEFPERFVPTVWENYVAEIEIENRLMELAIWDTAGAEEYDRLRALSYVNAHVVLICFSLDYPASFENVEQKWIPEIAHFCPGIPFILVGCKTDLRHDRQTVENITGRGGKMISTEYGEAMARRIGADAYLECSAKSDEGVKQVFHTAAMFTCSSTSKPKHKECIVL